MHYISTLSFTGNSKIILFIKACFIACFETVYYKNIYQWLIYPFYPFNNVFTLLDNTFCKSSISFSLYFFKQMLNINIMLQNQLIVIALTVKIRVLSIKFK